ncbi:Six-hairpin glycosidase-like protein [Panaeolus papilionaceus]|nr:Six-hairpin glycosidase-like protein [Panaeolus papilionaceus]
MTASPYIDASIFAVFARIPRKTIVQTFNLHRNASDPYSPLHLGNGNFAFGADITGLQTFIPHNTLSSWGWHNSSLPRTANQTSPDDFTGLQWLTHGRLVDYDQPNPAEADISQWMIANPHRINLGRVGLWFGGQNVSEGDLEGRSQVLDLWGGEATSEFQFSKQKVVVKTVVHPDSDTIGVQISSPLVAQGKLGVFFDYPYASGQNKFDAPFVGVWNATASHTTTLVSKKNGAMIQHDLDATTYFTDISWNSNSAFLSRQPAEAHRYILRPGKGGATLSFTATFAEIRPQSTATFNQVETAAASWWNNYWSTGAFVSLPLTNSSAFELQRRIILSQYLLAVNSAGRDPPQESGLVNNGWYGKFHLEMVFWHIAHWQLWGKWELYDRSIGIYERFLPTSIERAAQQGYQGARLGKMSDPSGRSAPGEINSLLIWQQPHPMFFAEMEWRVDPSSGTLKKWDTVLTTTADFMASFAWWNESTNVFDLGPPMYPVSENTNPNQTVNPAFELAYWRFGLDVASKWKQRQNKSVPKTWSHVRDNLAPFPVQDSVYVLYEGIQNMWTTPSLAEDHPALLGLYGWLAPDSRLDLNVFNATVQKIYETWNFPFSYGWDFPLLAMTAARMGDPERAVSWLLDPSFQFDALGMPVGGSRVPTPYFPGSSSLLLAVGMMAGGWDGKADSAVAFPKDWKVEVEGMGKWM